MSWVYRLFVAFVALAAPALGQEINTGSPGLTGPLTCSPAPCVLSPAQATQGGFDAPIVASLINPQNLLLGNLTLQCPFPTSAAFNLSTDGGSNWNDRVCMTPIFNNGTEYGAEDNPILGYDRTGAAYIGGFYFNDSGESQSGFEGFEKSTDGVNWTAPAPVVISRNYDPIGCWMAVDTGVASPYVNSVYMSCILAGPVVSHSTDGGATWHQVAVAPHLTGSSANANTSMTIGRDGTVYMSWMYCSDQVQACDNDQAYMLFSKSSDGGNTWTPPTLTATAKIHSIPHVQLGVRDPPAIAVDDSDGPHSGNLYVSMYNWTGTFMQVQVARSTDGGKTWSKPVPVSLGVTHDQFLPWISVSPTGLVGVSWLDRRNDPKNTDYQAYAGISANGGLSYDNVQLTTAFSNPNKGTRTRASATTRATHGTARITLWRRGWTTAKQVRPWTSSVASG